jgi:hypothetical protein
MVSPRRARPHALLLGAVLVATWLLWDTPVVYPVRILATFLHEASHGLAAVLTGGRIDRITVESDGSGVCWTAGGWRVAIIPAGYLGSMLWGSLILIGACRTRQDRLIAFVLGAGLTLVCIFYVRTPFALVSGLLLGAGLAAAGIWLSERVADAVLVFLGTVSCLYALFDLRTLWQVSGTGHNDADSFSREILPLPAGVWAVVWGALAAACLVVSLRIALRGPAARAETAPDQPFNVS